MNPNPEQNLGTQRQSKTKEEMTRNTNVYNSTIAPKFSNMPSANKKLQIDDITENKLKLDMPDEEFSEDDLSIYIRTIVQTNRT